MKNQFFFAGILIILFILKARTLPAQVADRNFVPKWIKENRTVYADSITDADYKYLSAWVNKNVKPADDYFIDLFKKHDVVIYGESHNLREHKDFIIRLIPRLYHEAGVRCIGWEFTTPSSDEELRKLTTAPTFDYPAQLDFARRQGSHAWPFKEHWDFIEAVRELNAYLPADCTKMALVGLDKEVDWVDVYIKQKTLSPDSPEFKAMLEIEQVRDVEMAANAENQTLKKGIKGFLFVGLGHDETHVGLPPEEPYKRPIMGQVLYKKYGDRVYQVCPDWGFFNPVNRAFGKKPANPVAFDMPDSPFSNIIVSVYSMGSRRLQNVARGIVYFGPRTTFHRNTFIEGFVTKEMFDKYKHYYEVDFGQTFNSAEEVNAYFRQRQLSVIK